MGRKPKLLLRILVIVLLVAAIGGYAYYQSKDFLAGPEIVITEPENGTATTSPLIILRGRLHNIAYASLNDREIFINDRGYFEEKLLLYPGYNILSIKARDRFGHATEKRMELVYRPLENQNGNIKMENGTTTAPQF